MQQGDTFKDSDGQVWTVGLALGQGDLSRCVAIRTESGANAVLRLALGPDDLRPGVPVPKGFEQAANDALLEFGATLSSGEWPFLPRLLDTVDLVPGKRKNPKMPGLLLHRYPSTLATRLSEGAALPETLPLLLKVLGHLEKMHAAGLFHGNLRPENILLNSDGEPVLDSLVTPVRAKWASQVRGLGSTRPHYGAPESEAPNTLDDCYALCALAWQAAVTGPPSAQGESPLLEVPRGMDKVALAALRDAALASLKRGEANARFMTRVAERLGAFVDRGLSGPAEPSPPYRFVELRELGSRLRNVVNLVSPTTAEVGKVLMAAHADSQGVFSGGQPVAFSVSVGSTSQHVGHEDLSVGLKVVDRDAEGDGRVPVTDAKFDVASHPSGRLRFSFELPDLQPGRYEVHAAFSIRDSGHEPAIATGNFEVRPPPGYVPPAPPENQPSAPLQLPPRPRPSTAPIAPIPTDAAETTVARGQDDAGEVLPLPIAPSSPGIAPSDPGIPPSDPGLPPEERAVPMAPVVATPIPMRPEPSVPEIHTPPPVARPAPVIQLQPASPAAAESPASTSATATEVLGAPQARPLPVAPAALRPPEPAPPPPAAPAGPGIWEAELPDAPLPGPGPTSDYLPGTYAGEDLPTWKDEPRRSLPEPLQRAVDLVLQEPVTAVAVLAVGLTIVAVIALTCMG